MPKCRVCGVELNDENWYPSYKKYHRCICKKCENLRTKEYWEKHKKEKQQYKRRYYEIHKEEIKRKQKQYSKNNKEKLKEYQRIKHYGITLQQELKILKAQNNKCAICNKPLTDLSEACVDHDHKTGKVRGVLCHECNLGIGKFKDNPKILIKAAVYLRNQGGSL